MQRLKCFTFFQRWYKILHVVSRVFLEVPASEAYLHHNTVWCKYLRHTTNQKKNPDLYRICLGFFHIELLWQTPSWSCTLYYSGEEAQIYISATSVLDCLDHSNNTYKFFKWLAFPFNVKWSSERLPAGASEQHHRFTGYARKVE